MKFLTKCPVCELPKRIKLFIKKRTFNVKEAGIIVSQNEMCGKCNRAIKKLTKRE